VLLLDEPTSGLDPGLEARTMAMLRRLADSSRAVAVVTHATKSLQTCDRIAVMGVGGELLFSGSPDAALRFFGVDEFDGIYDALETREWRATREDIPSLDLNGHAPRAASPAPRPRSRERRTIAQASVLADRYLRLLTRDRRNLLILLGQVPLLALGMVGLFDSNVFSRATGKPQSAAQLMFLLVTVAIWLGSIDSAREIVKERAVVMRERAAGVRPSAYLLSKVVILFSLAAVQTLALVSIVFWLRPLDEPGRDYFALGGLIVLTAFVAVAMGLVLSAVVRSQDQATSFIPLALIPQLFFAGAIVPMEKMGVAVGALSNVIFARWAFAGAGTALDMNDRIAADPQFSKVSGYGTSFFQISPVIAAALLTGFLALFLGIVVVSLRRRPE
jgi:energy-coupling factor transporter ATP-binding protein EcfA2